MVKIHEKVTFPQVLNMNDYMNGYDNIKNKVTLNKQSHQPVQLTENRSAPTKSSVAFEIKLDQNSGVLDDS